MPDDPDQHRAPAVLAGTEPALAADPDAPADAETCCKRGSELLRKGKPQAALEAYRRAAEMQPDWSDAHCGVGVALTRLGKDAEAVVAFEAARRLKPGQAAGWLNLGVALRKVGRTEEAVASDRAAIALSPRMAVAYSNLGLALADLGKCDEAIEVMRKAIALRPRSPMIYSNFSAVLSREGMFDEAFDACRRAIKLDPKHGNARTQEANLLLRRGEWAAGWASYEWRWHSDEQRDRRRHEDRPQWDGSPLAGRTLLIWGEQGVGDQVMFLSMVPDILADGARLVVESDPRLRPLLKRVYPEVTCFPMTLPVDGRIDEHGFDVHVPMGSLGRWYRGSADAFPARRAYLAPDPEKRDRLRERYRSLYGDRLLVGVSWRGGMPKTTRLRSIGLEAWAPILRESRAGFVSLQYGNRQAEIAALTDRTGLTLLHDPEVDPLKSIDGLAAQIAAMDLVISIDNSTVHVAGAIGSPVWILLPVVPDCRWLLDREDSPWYASARLFRQVRAGQWDDVIARVADELSAHIDRRR